MSLYSDLQGVANGLLDQFKQGTILLRVTTIAAGVTPDVPGAVTVVDYTLSGAVQGVPEEFIDGTRIVQGDLQVVAAVRARTSAGVAVNIAPDMNDQIVMDGRVRAIKKINPIPSAGTPVVYKIFFQG